MTSPRRSAVPELTDAPTGPAGDRRWSGLDGLRGLLAIVVLLYHGGAREQIPGGILSMDVFFVLSGFLITGLLLTESRLTGRIDLRAFWTRRAKRLLPALFALLAVVPVVWRLTADPAQFRGLRDDTFATLAYVANWHSIADGTSYFDAVSAPSPLLHMWSLGVEEQFYVLWPLGVLAVLWLAARRHGASTPGTLRRGLLAVCIGGALASAAVAVVLSATGASASRLYYGTDVRVQALLVGAALAVVLDGRQVSPRNRRRVASGGMVGALVMVVAVFVVDGEDPGLYRGGMLAFAVCSAAVCAALVLQPASAGARALSWRPLVALGRISYGVYLWHWPVDLLLDERRTGLDGPALFAVRAGATVAVAVISYHLIELPVRRLRPRTAAQRPRTNRRLVTASGLGAAVVAVVATTAAALPSSTMVPVAYTAITPGQVPVEVVRAPPSELGPASSTRLPPAPTVLYYGDSIGFEAQGPFADAMAAGGRVRVVLRAFPATAICDYLPEMAARVARERPAAVVVSFLGLGLPDCMHDSSGRPLQGDALVRRTTADARTALQILSARGATVYWSSTPTSWTLPQQNELTAAVRDVVQAHPQGRWVDAGAAVAPGNRWTRYLPCLPGEPCPTGEAMVRGPDIMHFCPRGRVWVDSSPPGRCPVWSSGAWRYAAAQAAPVLRQLGLTPPRRPVVSANRGRDLA